MRRGSVSAGLALGLLVLVSGAAGAKEKKPPATTDIAQFWEDPQDIAKRDLVHGPGGRDRMPKPGQAFQFQKLDVTGHSRGYDVKDEAGRKWDVKIGEEAATEVAVSRILWALGYHQPVTYYVSNWKLVDGEKKSPRKKPPEPGRFRLESDHKNEGEWSWEDFPFADSRPYRGMLVIHLIVNNWDLRPSQNRIFRWKEGPDAGKVQWIVQDVGGSLGRTQWPTGTRNDIDEFESQTLLAPAHDGRIRFDYRSRHGKLMEQLTAQDVVWACKLMSRLSDAQMADAFRTAGYSEDITARYVRKIRAKVAEGLALDVQGGGR